MEIAQIVQTVKCPNGATVLIAGDFLPKNDAERQERRRLLRLLRRPYVSRNQSQLLNRNALLFVQHLPRRRERRSMLFDIAQWLGILFGAAFLVWVTRPGTPVRRKRHPWFDRA